MNADGFYFGTAGWTIPKIFAGPFPQTGSHLQRYAAVFNCVEINSSFHREHMPKSYARWAAEVPPDFRFSLKLPKLFTHEQKLKVPPADLARVLGAMGELGNKFAVLLVQLPPSFALDVPVVRAFLSDLRERFDGKIVIEPRHISWTTPQAHELLHEFSVSKVIADPDPCPAPPPALTCDTGIYYWRLHGSPTIYRSSYEEEALVQYATSMKKECGGRAQGWCIFDNTTLGHATQNALQIMRHF